MTVAQLVRRLPDVLETRGGLWGLCAIIALVNLLPVALWPSLHAENEPTAMWLAGECLLAKERGWIDLLVCLRGDVDHNYGWSYYNTSFFAAWAFGDTYLTHLGVTGAFAVLLLAGSYRLGEHLGGAAAGRWSLFLVCGWPILLHFCRRTQFEHAIAACFVWFCLHALRSNHVSRVRALVPMILLTLYGTLAKPSMVAMFVPVAAAIWLLGIRGPLRRTLAGALGVLSVLATGVAVFAWYRYNAGLWDDAQFLAGSMAFDFLVFPYYDTQSGRFPQLRYLWYFGRIFTNYHVTVPIAVLAVASWLSAVRHRRFTHLALLAGYLGLVGLHTALDYKKYYYTMPALPAVAVVLGAWLATLPALRWVRVLKTSLVLGCLLLSAREHLGTWGPEELLPQSWRGSLGYNEPGAYTARPQRIPSRLESELPVLLALAEEHQPLHVGGLPRGGKLSSIVSHPERPNFEHVLRYEFGRRGVKTMDFEVASGAPMDMVQVLLLTPSVPIGEALDASDFTRDCERTLSADNQDIGERQGELECQEFEQQLAQLLDGSLILQPQPYGAGRVRAVALVQSQGATLNDTTAFTAWAYARAMGVEDKLPREVLEMLSGVDPSELRAAEGAQLKFLRPGNDQRPFPH